MTPVALRTGQNVTLRHLLPGRYPEPQYRGRIETSGCAEVLSAGQRRFVSVCSDGSMMTTNSTKMAGDGAKSHCQPFFDIEKDPVFGVPARVGDDAYFDQLPWDGLPMGLGSNRPNRASLVVAEREPEEGGWLPGGYQPLWATPPKACCRPDASGRRRLDAQNPGAEVWVYDVKGQSGSTGSCCPGRAILSWSARTTLPRFFVLSSMPAMMQSFSALDGKYLGVISGLSGVPWEMFGL